MRDISSLRIFLILVSSLMPFYLKAADNDEIVNSALRVETAVVDDGTVVLEPYAFADRVELRRIILPASLREIGEYAFLGCTGLEEIVLPSDIRKIGEGAFRECSSLKCIVLPEKLETIPRYAFAWCDSLEDVYFPSVLKDIGSHAFIYCGKLRKAFPGDKGCKDKGNVSGGSVRDGLLIVPDKVEHIGSNAFTLCRSLKEVRLPASVGELESYAFAGCDSLERIELPANDKMLGEYLLTGCISLKEVISRSPGRPPFDCDSPLIDPSESIQFYLNAPNWH